MTCADFDAILHEQFGPTQLRDHAGLAEHTAACGTCRKLWDQQLLLAEAIGAWREQIPDVDLTAAVIAARESEAIVSLRQSVAGELANTHDAAYRSTLTAVTQPAPWTAEVRTAGLTRPRNSRHALVAAVAALSALVVVILALSRHDVSPPDGSIVAGQDSSTGPSERIAPRVRDLATGQTDDADRDESTPYSDLAQLAAGAWDEVTLLVRPESTDSQRPGRGLRAPSKDGWIDGLQHQLKPIGRGLDNAFDFLWQAGQSGDG